MEEVILSSLPFIMASMQMNNYYGTGTHSINHQLKKVKANWYGFYSILFYFYYYWISVSLFLFFFCSFSFTLQKYLFSYSFPSSFPSIFILSFPFLPSFFFFSHSHSHALTFFFFFFLINSSNGSDSNTIIEFNWTVFILGSHMAMSSNRNNVPWS